MVAVDEDGKMTKVAKSINPKPWYFCVIDRFYFSPRFSNKSVLGKDKAIDVGDIKNLPKVITQVIEAATAGDLDEQLMACSRRK